MGFYFRYEKERMERKRIAEATKGVGKPKVGGPFELVDQNGKVWDSTKEMGGKFSLVRTLLSVSSIAKICQSLMMNCYRYTLDSHTARTFVPKNWTKWQKC